MGLPTRLLWTLGLSRLTETVEADGSVTIVWNDLDDFTGRIARRQTVEVDGDGRQAGVEAATLLTDHPGIRATDRIIADLEVWEVDGRPVAVMNPNAGQIHHYEAPLRRVDG